MIEKKEFYILSSKELDYLINKVILANSTSHTRYKYTLDWLDYPIFEGITWYLKPEEETKLKQYLDKNESIPGMARILMKKLCSLACLFEGNYIVKVEYEDV